MRRVRGRPFALRIRILRGGRVGLGHVGLDARVVVLFMGVVQLLVDVVVVPLQVVGELVRVAPIIVAAVAVAVAVAVASRIVVQ